MRVSKTKTARFAQVIRNGGRPELVTLWGDPKQNKGLRTAIRQNRVMTVHQENVGTAKDFGEVGFSPEKNVSYLIFPKSLNAFKDRRIVGIKYDLIEFPKLKGRALREGRPTAKRRGIVEKERRIFEDTGDLGANALRKFEVTIGFSAYTELTRVIAAKTKRQATEMALKDLHPPGFDSGSIARKVVKSKLIETGSDASENRVRRIL